MMTLGQHQEAFTLDVAKLVLFAESLGYKARLREVERKIETQEVYVKTGRSKTMNSMHLKSLAADIYFMRDGKIVYSEEIAKYWESLSSYNRAGLLWKSFKDGPHYERYVP